MCSASGLAAIIERDAIPLSPGARAAVEKGARWWDLVLGGGDDYELAFAVPPERVSELQTLAARLMFPLTPIGELVEGQGVTVTADGKPVALRQSGYRHR